MKNPIPSKARPPRVTASRLTWDPLELGRRAGESGATVEPLTRVEIRVGRDLGLGYFVNGRKVDLDVYRGAIDRILKGRRR